jgi:hypothetical protein
VGLEVLLVLLAAPESAIERTWQTHDSQGQFLALTFKHKSLKPFQLFSLRSEAGAKIACNVSHTVQVVPSSLEGGLPDGGGRSVRGPAGAPPLPPSTLVTSASEQKGKNSKGLTDFHLTTSARFWP